MRQTVLIILTIFLLADSFAQTTAQSKLYDSKGRLLADTTLKITKQQLATWTAIEDTLTKRILNKLTYPPELAENGISGKIIISFTVDSKGMFNDFRLEKHNSKMSSMHIKMFLATCFGSTIYFSEDFAKQGFKTDGNQSEKYYLPFNFTIDRDKTAIKNGWMTFNIWIIPITDREEPLIGAPPKSKK